MNFWHVSFFSINVDAIQSHEITYPNIKFSDSFFWVFHSSISCVFIFQENKQGFLTYIILPPPPNKTWTPCSCSNFETCVYIIITWWFSSLETNFRYVFHTNIYCVWFLKLMIVVFLLKINFKTFSLITFTPFKGTSYTAGMWTMKLSRRRIRSLRLKNASI